MCIINDCPKPISFIPYIVYPKNFKISKNFIKFQKFSKMFQNLKNFKFSKNFQIFLQFKNSKKIKIFIKYMNYQRHGWNIWYNEHYMKKSVSHAVSTLNLYHPKGHRPEGWYRVLGLIRHVIQILTCNIQYISLSRVTHRSQ